MNDVNDRLRKIPSVSRLQEHPTLRALTDEFGRRYLSGQIRRELDAVRQELTRTSPETSAHESMDLDDVVERIRERVEQAARPHLRPVVNATGIVLHTGLGRAPLAAAAIDAMTDVARGYCNLQLDLTSGERISRMHAVEELLRDLTGAEAAYVVNNNAAATILALAALALGREVVVSRGQLIEIGGSYRLPDVMRTSGTVLREVGTTNRTRLSDYAAAIGEQTAALMLVHTSNYAVVGFSESVALADLVDLGRRHGLPVIHDVGSGALGDDSCYGCSDEPVVGESIRAGADIVLLSGDKLVGGPQSGIIVGRRELIDQMSRHPLSRALRIDKLTLAALEATLRLHLFADADRPQPDIPLFQLLKTPLQDLRSRAERLASQLNAAGGASLLNSIVCQDDVTFVGGGSLPGQEIPTCTLVIEPAGLSAEELAVRLRTGQPPVVTRLQQDRLIIDLRSVFEHEDALIGAAFAGTGA